MDIDPEQLGQWLKERRARSDISQERLARDANITLRHYQKIENGEVTNPGINTILRLFAVLGANLDDLPKRQA